MIKDPVGSKGARLSAELSIASYSLVYMPAAEHIGISQRIEDEEERERLKTTLTAVVDEVGAADKSGNKRRDGYILRTVAEGATEAELRSGCAVSNSAVGRYSRA